ncbi:MAG: CBS domain-containing protein [Pelobacteraceae bacterium]
MNENYEILKTYKLKPGSSFMRPLQDLPEHVELSDPAISIMTDLRKVSVVVTRPNISIEQANDKMICYGVRLLLVLDSKDKIAGLLTTTDLSGDKPLIHTQEMGGAYGDIMVRDIMTPLKDLDVMMLEDVMKVSIGSVVATLCNDGRRHGLVVSADADGNQTVCGIFSITQIARKNEEPSQPDDEIIL